MKKFFIGLGVFGALLFVLLVVARFTGMLQFYRIPTASNEPTLKTGQIVFASSLKQPGRGDFIVFKNDYSDSVSSMAAEEKHSGYSYIKRLCGIPGDIVEMKNAVLYVNNKNFDASLDLNHYYFIPARQFPLIDEDEIDLKDGTTSMLVNDSLYLITLSKTLFTKYKNPVDLRIYLASDTTTWNNTGINSQRNKWTTDNFGPVTVPENGYLVLGDNRNNSLDSRHFGFIKKSDCKATVLQK